MFAKVLVGLIRFYRVAVSPWTPPSCRYQPTCSRYALEAVESHGALRGSWMAARRVARCHPWGGTGYDPVPSASGGADEKTDSSETSDLIEPTTTDSADGGHQALASRDVELTRRSDT